MKVLIINSYAGSLVLGAQAAGAEIIGSYEDAGYGLEIQQENFNLEFRRTWKEWPSQDLSETVVIAHPPCSAFSNQNSSKTRGVDSPAFACTVRVLEYAFKHRALAVALESVVPALEGAREVHEKLAQEHGYDVFRILQDANTFGLPQNRKRFWAVFVRREVLHYLVLYYEPRTKAVAEVMTGGDQLCNLDTDLILQWAKLTDAGLSFEMIQEILDGEVYGSLPSVLKKSLDLEGTLSEVAQEYCLHHSFLTRTMRLLDPAKQATTLMFDSWWFCQGRNLTRQEYCQVMGFPPDYRWGRFDHRVREFLSRGVCPPVATWVLSNLIRNLTDPSQGSSVNQPVILGPGETTDLT